MLPAQQQHLAFVLAEFQEFPVCPFFQLDKAKVKGSPSLKHTVWVPILGVICKLEESELCHFLYTIHKDVKLEWSLINQDMLGKYTLRTVHVRSQLYHICDGQLTVVVSQS